MLALPQRVIGEQIYCRLGKGAIVSRDHTGDAVDDALAQAADVLDDPRYAHRLGLAGRGAKGLAGVTAIEIGPHSAHRLGEVWFGDRPPPTPPPPPPAPG